MTLVQILFIWKTSTSTELFHYCSVVPIQHKNLVVMNYFFQKWWHWLETFSVQRKHESLLYTDRCRKFTQTGAAVLHGIPPQHNQTVKEKSKVWVKPSVKWIHIQSHVSHFQWKISALVRFMVKWGFTTHRNWPRLTRLHSQGPRHKPRVWRCSAWRPCTGTGLVSRCFQLQTNRSEVSGNEVDWNCVN